MTDVATRLLADFAHYSNRLKLEYFEACCR